MSIVPELSDYDQAPADFQAYLDHGASSSPPPADWVPYPPELVHEHAITASPGVRYRHAHVGGDGSHRHERDGAL